MIKSRKCNFFWPLHNAEMVLTCTGVAQKLTFFTSLYPSKCLNVLSVRSVDGIKCATDLVPPLLDRPYKWPKTASFRLPPLFSRSARYSCLTSFLIYPWHHWCTPRQKLDSLLKEKQSLRPHQALCSTCRDIFTLRKRIFWARCILKTENCSDKVFYKAPLACNIPA